MSGIEFFIIANPVLTYAAIFFGMFIEGEGIILLSSVFAWQGHLSWLYLGIAVITGVIAGDIVWYWLGRTLKGTAFGNWLDNRYEKQGGWIKDNVVANYGKYAIFAKFMYFTTHPTVFLVGWHELEFKKFLKITVFAGVLWALAVMLAGYFFGLTIELIGFKKIMKRIEIFVLILFGLLFVAERLLQKKFIKKMQK
jgi:membrane-associated protein